MGDIFGTKARLENRDVWIITGWHTFGEAFSPHAMSKLAEVYDEYTAELFAGAAAILEQRNELLKALEALASVGALSECIGGGNETKRAQEQAQAVIAKVAAYEEREE